VHSAYVPSSCISSTSTSQLNIWSRVRYIPLTTVGGQGGNISSIHKLTFFCPIYLVFVTPYYTLTSSYIRQFLSPYNTTRWTIPMQFIYPLFGKTLRTILCIFYSIHKLSFFGAPPTKKLPPSFSNGIALAFYNQYH